MSFADRLNAYNKSEAELWQESYAKAVASSNAMRKAAEDAEDKARAVTLELAEAGNALARAERHVGALNPGDKGWREALAALQDATTLHAAHKAREAYAKEEARKKRMHFEAYGKPVVPSTMARTAPVVYGDGFVPDSVFLG